jgi:hypothetical protein
MPNKKEKGKHSGNHDHHGMPGPHGEQTEEDHELLKGKPYPLTSKPTHTNDTKPPVRTERRNG